MSVPTYFDIALVNTGEAGKGTPCFCVAYDDGLLDVNLLAPKQCATSGDEQGVLEELLSVAEVSGLNGKVPPAAKPAAKAAKAPAPKPKPKPKPKPAPPPEPAPEDD